jgi:hypothetical protein
LPYITESGLFIAAFIATFVYGEPAMRGLKRDRRVARMTAAAKACFRRLASRA